MIRNLLLAAARQPWLQQNVPEWRWVRRAVRSFMPGETLAEALAAAERLHQDRIESAFTLLGENLAAADDAERVADEYRALLREGARRGLRSEISPKLTQLAFDLDESVTTRLVRELALLAKENGSWLWVDMEGSAYTERTVALYERLRSEHANVGLCLQAYLFRTPSDIARLVPLRPAIRLVKGAYLEPKAMAHPAGRAVDAAYASLGLRLLGELLEGRVSRVVFGTHDADLVRGIAAEAGPLGVELSRIEVQMLYGIRSDELRRLRDEGYDARCLIAYGTHWYAWYMRRLAERPANLLFALRQLLPV